MSVRQFEWFCKSQDRFTLGCCFPRGLLSCTKMRRASRMVKQQHPQILQSLIRWWEASGAMWKLG